MTTQLQAAEEAKAILDVYKDTLEMGTKWAVVDARWWAQWRAYSGLDTDRKSVSEGSGPRPGPMNNERLQDEEFGSALKVGIVENRDFSFINQEAFDLLHQWYGGQPKFIRDVAEYGATKKTRIDLYPFFLNIFISDAKGKPLEDKDSANIQAFGGKTTIQTLAGPILSLDTTMSDEKKKDTEEEKEQFRAWTWDGVITTPAEEPDIKETSNDFRTVSLSDTPMTSTSEPGTDAPKTDEPGEDEKNLKPATDQPKVLGAETKKKEIPKDGWRLLTADELRTPVESLFPTALSKPAKIMLEKPQPELEGGWARKVYVKPWNEFAVGDSVDAKDTVGTWYESTVKGTKPGKVLIHYNEWNSDWDEWLDAKGDRLAPFRTKSKPYKKSDYSGYSYSSYGADEDGVPSTPGCVGLRNLGNTCFMNSTLQCLSHSPKLTDYFVEGQYLPHINRSNPLGWKGKVADTYGELMSKVWSNKHTVVAPRTFKDAIGEFQPRFSGYQQQDSSELLGFLLDGLHEDLNLVREKPPTSGVESKDREDKVVAEEAWEVYLKRNKSFIVDTIMGQLKSKLTCPTCGKISITFDPFMFLSVPLPMVNEKFQEVKVVHLDKALTSYGCIVSKEGRIADLKKAASALSGVPFSRLVCTDVWQHRIDRMMEDNGSVQDFREMDHCFMYEVPELEEIPTTVTPPPPRGSNPFHNAAINDPEPGEGPRENNENDPKDNKDKESGTEGTDEKAPKKIRQSRPPIIGVDYVPVVIHQYVLERNPHYHPDYTYAKEFHTKTISFPQVIVVPLNQPVTRAQLCTMIHEHIRPWIKADVPSEAKPYRIVQLGYDGRECLLCSYNAPCNGCDLPDDDKEFTVQVRFGKDPQFSFGCIWNEPEKFFAAEKVNDYVRHSSAVQEGGSKKDALDLGECIKAFCVPETLSEEDPWYCNVCKEHKRAQKKMDIWKLPDLLVVHLKRFSYSKMWREKINSLVNFPIEGFKLGEYSVNGDCKDYVYDLYAVSNHMGGMGGGHYTAYCKNLVSGEWYCHDDSRVSRVSRSEIVSPSAYVLFYHRRGLAKHGSDSSSASSSPSSSSSSSSFSSSSSRVTYSGGGGGMV